MLYRPSNLLKFFPLNVAKFFENIFRRWLLLADYTDEHMKKGIFLNMSFEQ